MIILLNTSKTMGRAPLGSYAFRAPAFTAEAQELQEYMQKYSPEGLQKLMHISPKLADLTHALIAKWDTKPSKQTIALDAFQGDIYRGLLAKTLPEPDRLYADTVLRIISGMYGILRPMDAIYPYRLELLYKVTGKGFKNLYEFWGAKAGEHLACHVAHDEIIVNLASLEYFRLVRPYIHENNVIAPQFLTKNIHAGKVTFVTIHAKVARGAFARWLIQTKITDPKRFCEFAELDYIFDSQKSSPLVPVFVKTV